MTDSPEQHSKCFDFEFEPNFDRLVSERVEGIWKTLQETSNNLLTCDQLLGNYSHLHPRHAVREFWTQTESLATITKPLLTQCFQNDDRVSLKNNVFGESVFKQSTNINKNIDYSEDCLNNEIQPNENIKTDSVIFTSTTDDNLLYTVAQELKVLQSLVAQITEEKILKSEILQKIENLQSYLGPSQNLKIQVNLIHFALQYTTSHEDH